MNFLKARGCEEGPALGVTWSWNMCHLTEESSEGQLKGGGLFLLLFPNNLVC